MIRQTWALLVDGYRALNAGKLFWITLILSALFIAGFATLGADARGFSILGWHWDMPLAKYFYKEIFRYVIIGFWLTWAAAILALVSTAGIFPDLISGGTIDLYLSKPITRTRLFLTKYVSGLLFVTLQVALIAVGGFLTLGFRGGEWKPGLFLAIPIVVCFFSYLFSACALLGVLTRSTIAALLLTIVLWGGTVAVHYVELSIFQARVTQEYLSDYYRQQIRDEDAQIAVLEASLKPDQTKLNELRERRMSDQRAMTLAEPNTRTMRHVHQGLYAAMTVLPKTTETIDLLDRILFTTPEVVNAEEEKYHQFMPGGGNREFEAQMAATRYAKARTAEALRSRSVGWVVGTSLVFESVILALAVFVFSRRDY